MPKRTNALNSLSRVERESLAGELVGASIVVTASPGLRAPIAGTIVDESLSTFSVRLPGRARARVLPKAGLEGRIALPSGELPLRGDALRVRPEDRTKRLLAGPRRLR